MFAETQMCKVKATENVIPVQHPFNNISRNVLNFFKNARQSQADKNVREVTLETMFNCTSFDCHNVGL